MAPPKFADVGKTVKNLFSDDFNEREAKVTIKSTVPNGMTLKIDGSRQESGTVSGSVETKYSHESGVSIKEKWNTKNVVTTELSLENNPIPRTKFTVESAFSPNSGFSGVQLSAEHSKDAAFVTAALSQSALTLTNVIGIQNYLVGGSVTYDFSKRNVSANKLAVSLVDREFAINTSISNAEVIEGSIYRNPPKGFEYAVRFTWNRRTTDTTFEIGAKKQLDATSFVKTKIDKNLNLGIAYSQKLGSGVTATISALLNGKQLVADGHSLGLALTFDN